MRQDKVAEILPELGVPLQVDNDRRLVSLLVNQELNIFHAQIRPDSQGMIDLMGGTATRWRCSSIPSALR